MKKIRRTDPHRKSAIVPAEYTHVLSYNGATSQDGWPVPSFGFNCEIDRRVYETDEHGNRRIVRNGEHAPDGRCCIVGLNRIAKVKWAEHGAPGKCTACGTHFVYGEVWRHEPTGEHIHVGHICGENYGLLADRSAFELEAGRAKAAAAAQLQRKINAEKREAFLADHSGLAEALETDHHIVADIAARFRRYCELSEKQIALVFKIANEIANLKPEENHVPAPIASGRQTVEGQIVSIKAQESCYGVTVRMTVKVMTADGVWLAWGTKPTALGDAERGDTVRFSAKLKQGRDPHFALFSRPTKAEIVTKAEAA